MIENPQLLDKDELGQTLLPDNIILRGENSLSEESEEILFRSEKGRQRLLINYFCPMHQKKITVHSVAYFRELISSQGQTKY